MLQFSCPPYAPYNCAQNRVKLFSPTRSIFTFPYLRVNFVDLADISFYLAAAVNHTVTIRVPAAAGLTASSDVLGLQAWASVNGARIDLTDYSDLLPATALLPSLANNFTVAVDPCRERVAGVWCLGNPARVIELFCLEQSGLPKFAPPEEFFGMNAQRDRAQFTTRPQAQVEDRQTLGASQRFVRHARCSSTSKCARRGN
jgi:hypothetical protein